MTRLPGAEPTRVRLFVLPHAGGGAAAYRPWRASLPADVELCLVHLPGREGRIGEPPLRSLDALADDLLPGVAAAARAPYVLFGHSMGALVAWTLTRRLAASGAPPPARLLLSAHRAPHVPDPRGPLHGASDERLLGELARLGGTPPEVLEHPELMALVLPVFRADLEAAGSVRTGQSEPDDRLPCGVTVMGGRDDATVAPEALEAWREHAPAGADGFRLRLFDGGHFYLGAEAMAFLAEELRRAG